MDASRLGDLPTSKIVSDKKLSGLLVLLPEQAGGNSASTSIPFGGFDESS